MAKEENEQIVLWSAFRNGEEEAFSRLFFEHYDSLYHYGRRIAPEPAFIKDVIQDFFLHLYETRDRLAPEVVNIRAYLLISFRRNLLHALKQQHRSNSSLEEFVQGEHFQFAMGIEDVIIEKESETLNKQLVGQLLSELPPRQREIIYLKYYLDLSLPEISETLAISYQVVANHLYRSLKKLQASPTAKKFLKLDIWLLLSLYPLWLF